MRKAFKVSPMLLTLLIIAAGILFYFIRIPFLDLIELKTIDLRFMARGEKEPGPTVVLAVIDEKSIDQDGRWIWPRDKIADLVAKISDAGARVIALDMVFPEPDNSGNRPLVQNIYQKLGESGSVDEITEKYLEHLLESQDKDNLLAEAIRNSKAPVVLGYFFHERGMDIAHLDASQINLHESLIQNSRIRQIRYESEAALEASFFEVDTPEPSIPVISNAAGYSGFFNMRPDKDGVLRWIPAMLYFNGGLYANLSLQALSAYWQAPLSLEMADYGAVSLKIGDQVVPTGEKGEIMINYRGGARTFPHISASDILRGRISKDHLKDRIVLVGATAVAIYDLRVTPFANDFPGVETHANLIDTILTRDFIFFPAWVAYIDFLSMIMAGLFLGVFVSRVTVLTGGGAAIALLAGYIYLCVYLFARNGIVLNMVYPSTVMLMVYIIISAYRYLKEEGQKRFIKNAFSTYVSPAVVDQLIKSPEKLMLGGEKREITAFFSDLEGFTTISEKLSPESLVELLNEFLTEMADIIVAHSGTVDKFEGDAIIAMFGAPVAVDDHALLACRACIQMQKRLETLREKWLREIQLTIRMRIGLCSGPAVVGNMGSKTRFDYTMMGDTVNTAARLEGVNKVYGTYIMISESTFEYVKEQIVARELDAVNVVGKERPVKVYQLIGIRGEVSRENLGMIDLYQSGLTAYRNQKWDDAIGFFQKAQEIISGDAPCRVMIARCEEYRKTPPGDGWNGAYVLKSK
ncbi:MAG: adenylate/guanylate cyclase domain-containing protein [Desulfobacterales bacterium]|nr:adenylate/guanylate cyclase domain-containing protein [Desulfobacterales bacterium]